MPSSASLADWFSPSDEGQLSVDAFREDGQMVIRAMIAGVNPNQVDISVHGDLLTIRGKREFTKDIANDDWFYKECYWGAFSRSIVLPYEVASDRAKASLKNGILEIRLPIREQGKKVQVTWDEDAG